MNGDGLLLSARGQLKLCAWEWDGLEESAKAFLENEQKPYWLKLGLREGCLVLRERQRGCLSVDDDPRSGPPSKRTPGDGGLAQPAKRAAQEDRSRWGNVLAKLEGCDNYQSLVG